MENTALGAENAVHRSKEQYQSPPDGKGSAARAKANTLDISASIGEISLSLNRPLSETHKEKLALVSPDVIRDRGYSTVTDSHTLEALGFPKSQNPALLIPWWNVDGSIGGYQIRPDAPMLDSKGRAQKYLFPKGHKNFADVPTCCRPDLANPQKPLWIVEGAIKADYLASQGVCAVGLAGVSGWRHTNSDGGKTTIPCFHDIALNNRAVYIAFDSDSKEKQTVFKQARELMNRLELKGARCLFVGIPEGPNGEKQGPDDYLRNGGTIEGLQSYVVTHPKPPREIPKAPDAPDPQKVAEGQLDDEFIITKGYALTDTGNAERFISQHGRKLLFSKVLGWHIWNNGAWERDETDSVFEMGKRTIRAIYKEASDAPDDGKRIKIGEWAKTSESLPRRNAMIEIAGKDGPKVKVSDFDKDPWLFNVRNGTIDLRTGQFREHRREDMITKIAPVTYDPKAQCPQFLRFLATILNAHEDIESAQELGAFLQCYLGYTLTGSTREQCFAVLHGAGSNGKSTLLNAVRFLMGDYSKQATPDTLMQKKFGDGISNDVARLRGARMVTAIETNEGRRLDEAKIKEMTGGDPVTARFMRQEFFEFIPEFKIFLATNHKPEIQGIDDGIWRRVRLIPFDVQFWNPAKGESGPAHLEADKTLEEKLKTELPGILNWAISGCIRWQSEGLPAPKKILEATADYRTEQDPLETFLTEKCFQGPQCKVTNKDLSEAYDEWRKAENCPPLSHRAFPTRMKQKGYEQHVGTGNIRWWLGLGLLAKEQSTTWGNDRANPDR